MADDRGIALCFDMGVELARVRWVSEVEDRHGGNCLGELDCWGHRQEADKVGRCGSEYNCPVLAYDSKVPFD